jgi:hypothetical protein
MQKRKENKRKLPRVTRLIIVVKGRFASLETIVVFCYKLESSRTFLNSYLNDPPKSVMLTNIVIQALVILVQTVGRTNC